MIKYFSSQSPHKITKATTRENQIERQAVRAINSLSSPLVILCGLWLEKGILIIHWKMQSNASASTEKIIPNFLRPFFQKDS